MKVAIPLFQERVSPHFSTAPEALLVQTEGGRVCATWKIDLAGLSATERRMRFVDMGIEALLCGGIDAVSRSWFEQRGIRVEADRMGNAREEIERCLNGHTGEVRKKV
jgi:predicted Fe-Mo cluster-binding NifX family protein